MPFALMFYQPFEFLRLVSRYGTYAALNSDKKFFFQIRAPANIIPIRRLFAHFSIYIWTVIGTCTKDLLHLNPTLKC